MRNRSTKKGEGKLAERATGQVAPFPFHRAHKIQQQLRKTQAEYQEQQTRQQQARDKTDNK